MNISLPKELKAFVDQQVAARAYGSASEDVRELLRRERDGEHLRGLLLGGWSRGLGGWPTRPTSTGCASASASTQTSRPPCRPGPPPTRRGPAPRQARAEVVGRRLPVVVLPRAEQDIGDVIGRYLEEAGVDVAQRFTEALAGAFALLAPNPAMDSLRQASALALPGMRCWPLRPWPHVIFCLERERQVDVVRVLHGARDIPASLADPGAAGG